MAFQDFDQISQRRAQERKAKIKKRITIAVVLIVVLLIVIGAFVAYTLQQKNDTAASHPKAKQEKKPKAEAEHKKPVTAHPPPPSPVAPAAPAPGLAPASAPAPALSPLPLMVSDKAVASMCASTDFKESCESTLTKAVEDKTTTTEPKELLKASIVVVNNEIDKAIAQLNTMTFDTPEKKAAFDDCIALLNDAKEELNETVSTINGKELTAISSAMPDVLNYLSAVMSYQQTCKDGVPEGPEQVSVTNALNLTRELSSNSLAIVSNTSDILSAFQLPSLKRRLLSKDDTFPTWMNQNERRMLKASKIEYTPNKTVAKDGSGDFTTINAALAALPASYEGRYVIYVKEGIYEENVVITKKMVNLTMYGDGSQKSVITGSKNRVDGATVYSSATFVAIGNNFMAQSLGFKNTAGPEKEQAVALRVQSDHSIFLNCRMEGYENTLYAQAHRQFYRSCYITGTVDIIFGDAAAVFQNCNILVKKPLENQVNTITAHGRVDKRETTGIVLQNCVIIADEPLIAEKAKFKTYLGRPFEVYARTIVMETEIGDFISPEGWVSIGDQALDTLYFGEFQNTGPGAATTGRVTWPGYKALSRDDAMKYTVGTFIQGETWLNVTGVPVRLGLQS